MTALADNKDADFKQGELLAYPVVAADIIYRGALVKINAAGYLAPCAAEAGAVFAGVAYEQKDNSAGSAGDLKCRVQTDGVVEMVAAGMAQSDLKSKVYATDDNLVSTTQGADEQEVGVIEEVISATRILVRLKNQI